MIRLSMGTMAVALVNGLCMAQPATFSLSGVTSLPPGGHTALISVRADRVTDTTQDCGSPFAAPGHFSVRFQPQWLTATGTVYDYANQCETRDASCLVQHDGCILAVQSHPIERGRVSVVAFGSGGAGSHFVTWPASWPDNPAASAVANLNDCTGLSAVEPLATWRRWQDGALSPLGQSFSLHPRKPIIPIFHGWTSSSDAEWIGGVAGCLQARFPDAQVIVADATEAMAVRVFDPDTSCSLAAWVEEGCAARLVNPLMYARAQINPAAEQLAQELRCAIAPGGTLDIPFIFGHSYGRAMAAVFASSLAGRGDIGTLWTADSPVMRTDLDPMFGAAQPYVKRHINSYSRTFAALGFGNRMDPVVYPKTINVHRAIPAGTCNVLQIDHTCVTEIDTAFLCSALADDLIQPTEPGASDVRDFLTVYLTSGGTDIFPDFSPVTYDEGVVESVERYAVSIGDTLTAFGVMELSQASRGLEISGESLTLRTPAGPLPSFTFGDIAVPAGGAFIVFNYETTGFEQGQVGTVWVNDRLAWSVRESTSIPRRAVITVPIGAAPLSRLTFALSRGEGSSPPARLTISGVTLVPFDLLSPPCRADLSKDGLVDFSDYLEFLNVFEAGGEAADFNGDGLIDFSDYLEFLNLYEAGC